MRYNQLIIVICLAVFAAAPAVVLAQAASSAPTVDRVTHPGQSRFSDMACIQQLDQIGNFVRMLCVSPDPRHGGKMKYNPPARNDGEVWRDLGRQRSDQPFWN